MQGAALAAAGIPLRYDALHVEPGDLVRVLRELVAEGAAGNVTIPHKEAVAAACDRLTPVASRVGAVNTFWVDAGRLWGDNTDVGGFDALARGTLARGALGRVPERMRVAVLGAGGAAAAVLVATAAWAGCTVALHARGEERARQLVQRLGYGDRVRVSRDVAEAIGGAGMVVNATPLGLHAADVAPAPIGELEPGAVVLDLVYRRGGTRWMHDARAAGHDAADGLGMLVEQGALAFSRWFGMEPDRAAMWRALG